MENVLDRNDEVVVLSTDEKGKVVLVDHTYKQVEVLFNDNSYSVLSFSKIRKV